MSGLNLSHRSGLPGVRHQGWNLNSSNSLTRAVHPLSIYAVDDFPGLTELYMMVLTANGYRVRTFTDRIQAWDALRSDAKKPALLITDYLGHSVPTEQFIRACRAVHPGVRILVASGFSQMPPLSGLADRVLQKPFTAEELEQEVRATLAEAH